MMGTDKTPGKTTKMIETYTCDRCGRVHRSEHALIGRGEFSFNNAYCHACFNLYTHMVYDLEELKPLSEGKQRVKITKKDIENIAL